MKHSLRWYKQRTPDELVKINQGLTLRRQEVKFEQLKLNEVLTDLVRYPPPERDITIRVGKRQRIVRVSSVAVLGRRYPVSSIWEWYRRKEGYE